MGAHYPWTREIDESVVLKSRIVLDEWEQGFTEHGELLIPLEENLLSSSDVYADLSQIVAGHLSGRDDDTQWTLFLSGGTGIEDVAVAARLYQVAMERGVGTEFEFDLPYEFEF
jgi:ornithine cyclodeaminase/alanine dehydrogenase-like protein (mu-crystallin family)